MRDAVRAAAPLFAVRFEGRTPYLYLDEEGLVTCADGNLVDPIAVALALPWEIDGRPAIQDEIADDWSKVKASTALEKFGGGAFASLTRVRLSDASIDALARATAEDYDAQMRARFSNWDALRADAQLATISLCWADGAYGVGHRFPKFDAALLEENFSACAIECHLDVTGNPGLVGRNAANQRLFLCAQAAADRQMDPELLTGWP